MCGRRVAALAFGLMLAAVSASAQTLFSGVVLGPDGMPVEGITIYVTHVETKAQLEFATTAEGRFEFSGLTPGDYRVTGAGLGVSGFTVTLAAFEPVFRELTLPFGPFSVEWLVLPETVLSAVGNGGGRPGFRCSDRMLVSVNGVFLPFCNLSFIVDEFEQGDARRSEAVVAGPRIARAPDQRYPPALAEARIEGTVIMEGRVGTDGTLMAPRVVSSSDPALADAAVASASRATWDPALLRGNPVEVPITITVQFRLQQAAAPPVRVVQSRAME